MWLLTNVRNCIHEQDSAARGRLQGPVGRPGRALLTAPVIVYPTETTLQTYDMGEELVANGFANYTPFLRVKAKLNASSDSFYTPIFTG